MYKKREMLNLHSSMLLVAVLKMAGLLRVAGLLKMAAKQGISFLLPGFVVLLSRARGCYESGSSHTWSRRAFTWSQDTGIATVPLKRFFLSVY